MRPLSQAGLTASAGLAAAAAARGVRPDLIWHSGKLRARQTAELFWRACNPLAAFAAARGLQPDDPPRWIHDELVHDTRSILLVGHLPHLSGLLYLLRGSPPDTAGPRFPLHGCVALEPEGNGWTEVWRMEPER